MMWIFLGVIVGILAGVATQFTIPVAYARYTAVALMAIMDSLFGAWRALLVSASEQKKEQNPSSLKERKEDYSGKIFLTGLFFNTALAAAITYLGDRLGLDLYLAALVAFTIRIFGNVGTIRRTLMKKFFHTS